MPYKLQKLVAAKRFSSPVTKQVLSAVVRYMNENGTGAFPSVKTIASDISRGRSTVFKHMAMLKADGLLIEVGKRPCHGGATKVYNLGYKALQTLPDEKGKGRPAGGWEGSCTRMSSRPAHGPKHPLKQPMKEKDGPGRDVDDDETTTISDAARIDDPFISRLIAAMGLDLEVALANGWNDACTVDLVQQWQNIFGLSKNDILKAAIENAERHGEPPRFPTTLHRALKVHALPGHGDRPRLPKISLAFDAQNFGLEEEDPRFMAISDGLKAHLEPRRPHKNVCSDPDTLQQEADRLLHILLMELPRAGYEPLLKEVWTHIHQNALIGSWPFRKHVVAACHAARKKPAPTQQRNAAPVSDHKSMLALKVREKQPIAMAQLYGVLMAELVVAGEVNAQALEDLRDQAHAQTRKAMGTQKATAERAEMTAKFCRYVTEFEDRAASSALIAAE